MEIDEVIPDSYVCPITRRIFIDPVMLGFGGKITFERVEIENWLQHHNTNPLTNQPLIAKSDRLLIPNLNLGQSIEKFVQSIPWKIISSNELRIHEQLNEESKKVVFLASYRKNIVALLKLRQTILGERECNFFIRLGNHPHLIRIFGSACLNHNNEVILGDPNAIVTELAPLGDLISYFTELAHRDEALSLIHMLLIAEQVADGMTAVHTAGIIHRDLAARNIMVFAMDVNSPNRTIVKVGDYSLAAITDQQSFVMTYGSNSITPFRWMSPETIRSFRWSKKSDVWAFGVLLWEILSQGDFPYGYLDDSEVARGVDERKLHLTRPIACPEDVWQLVKSCWAMKPKDRPSFIELRTSLQQLRANYSDLLSLHPSSPVSIGSTILVLTLLEGLIK